MTDSPKPEKKSTLDVLTDMWTEDAQIDKNAIDEESIKIPKLQAKWAKLLKQYTFAAKDAENEYKKLRHKKWRYYSGKMDQAELKELGWPAYQYTLKNDIEFVLEGDDDLIKAGLKKFTREELADFCKLVLTELQKRGWILKTSLDFTKFTSGG